MTAAKRFDYRDASNTLTIFQGFRWADASENTGAAGDYFNEAEASYPLDLHQVLGLRFDMNLNAPVRYSPFFKIRGWQSFVEVPTVTLEGVQLQKDVDYKAAVKPVARAHFANPLTWHCTLDDSSANTCTTSGLDLDVGSDGGVAGVTIERARYSNGARFDANSDYIYAPGAANDFSVTQGTIEFWYQPNQDHNAATGTLVFWRVAMKPGRPVAMGVIDGTPFIGLPGNPVASFVTFARLARPAVLASFSASCLYGSLPAVSRPLRIPLGHR